MADKDENLKNVQLQANRWLAEKDKENVSFIQALADKGESFDLSTLKGCLALKVKYEAWKKEQEQAPSHNNQADNKPVNSFNVRQNHTKSQTEAQNQIDNSWIAEKIQHWDNEWCQKPDKNYKFERIDADISPNTLKFDIYKTEADKAAGKKAVTVEYNNERDVSLSTEDGKAPDFEFFDKMVREAKENEHVPAVNFANADDMTPDFKAKLAIACIKHGVPMTGFDEPIHIEDKYFSKEELEKLRQNVELTKKIEKYNAPRLYKHIETCAENNVRKYKEENKGKPFDLANFTKEAKENHNPFYMEEAAITFATCKKYDVECIGVDEVTKDTHGAFLTTDLKYFSDEINKTIVNFNYEARKKQIDGIRARLDEKIASGDQEALAVKTERDNVAQARENIRKARESGKSPKEIDKAIIKKRKEMLHSK